MLSLVCVEDWEKRWRYSGCRINVDKVRVEITEGEERSSGHEIRSCCCIIMACRPSQCAPGSMQSSITWLYQAAAVLNQWYQYTTSLRLIGITSSVLICAEACSVFPLKHTHKVGGSSPHCVLSSIVYSHQCVTVFLACKRLLQSPCFSLAPVIHVITSCLSHISNTMTLRARIFLT